MDRRPVGLLGAGLEPEEYRRRYRHRLHRLTPRITAELVELRQARTAPADLILCCYEPAGAGVIRCRWPEFLAEELGEEVTEGDLMLSGRRSVPPVRRPATQGHPKERP